MTEAEDNVEKDDQYLSQILRRGQKPRFIVSSVANTLKAEFAKIIEKLGWLLSFKVIFILFAVVFLFLNCLL